MGLGIMVAVDGIPDATLSDAALVEVHERMGLTTTFRLTYGIDIVDGDLPMLGDARLNPGSVISLLVPVGSKTICLVKGPVTGHRSRLVHGGAGSTLDIEGGDSSLVMDRDDVSQTWGPMLDSNAVYSILGKYRMLPDVDPTTSMRSEETHTLAQRSTDLTFVRQLADRNGFLFWITTDDIGVDTAHFKPAPFDADPDQTLTINLESPAFETLDLAWDAERPTGTIGAQVDLSDLSSIDVSINASPLVLLGAQSLTKITRDKTRNMHVALPADDAGDLQSRAEAALNETNAFIVASAETTLDAFGDVVRSHTVVRLDGLGKRHSGSYFVSAVKHTITAAEHRMQLEFIRNGWN